MAFKLVGNFNRDAFEKAIRYLVDRHEVLRTRIGLYESEGYQDILPATDFKIEFEDIEKISEINCRQYVQAAIEAESEHRFELDKE
eukprot:7353604-Prorocentrum_lima.AAC.1